MPSLLSPCPTSSRIAPVTHATGACAVSLTARGLHAESCRQRRKRHHRCQARRSREEESITSRLCPAHLCSILPPIRVHTVLIGLLLLTACAVLPRRCFLIPTARIFRQAVHDAMQRSFTSMRNSVSCTVYVRERKRVHHDALTSNPLDPREDGIRPPTD